MTTVTMVSRRSVQYPKMQKAWSNCLFQVAFSPLNFCVFNILEEMKGLKTFNNVLFQQ